MLEPKYPAKVQVEYCKSTASSVEDNWLGSEIDHFYRAEMRVSCKNELCPLRAVVLLENAADM